MVESYRGSDLCILDCVYVETTQTYYVLDVMYWKTQPLYDSDTEFRFYWLHTKLTDEIPAVSVRSRYNPYVFVVCVRPFPCARGQPFCVCVMRFLAYEPTTLLCLCCMHPASSLVCEPTPLVPLWHASGPLPLCAGSQP